MPVDTAQNPFALLTLVAAPALLTNATSVLVLSTVNRILRAGDRMRALSAQLEEPQTTETKRAFLLAQVNRVEKQALLQLRGLHSIYVALGCFASAVLVSVLGASLAESSYRLLFIIMAGLGLAVGVIGVTGLVWGSVNLFQATRISIQNITEEAALIRKREAEQQHPLARITPKLTVAAFSL
jgi:hypothetical protein